MREMVWEPVTNNGKRPEAAVSDEAAASDQVAASDQATASDQASDNNNWAEKALDDDELEA